MKSGNPKFKKGDLVFFRKFKIIPKKPSLGIVVSEPQLMFVHDWEMIPHPYKNYWCYNIIAEEQLFKDIPEDMLRSVNDEDEKYSE